MRVKWNDILIYLNNIHILHSKYVTHNYYYKSCVFPACRLKLILNIKRVIFLLRNLHFPLTIYKIKSEFPSLMLFKSLSPVNETALIMISIHFCPFSPSDALSSDQLTAHSLLQAHRVLTASLPWPKQVLCRQCFLPSIFVLRFYQFFKIHALSCSISSFFFTRA